MALQFDTDINGLVCHMQVITKYGAILTYLGQDSMYEAAAMAVTSHTKFDE